MNFEQQISQGIKESMIQKIQIDFVLWEVLNHASGKEVTQEMILSTLQRMVKQRNEYQIEIGEIMVIEEFLPKQLSREEK